jgi:hypothetical protein
MEQKKLNILILYSTHYYPILTTTWDLLYCFKNYSEHNCFYYSASVGVFPEYLKKIEFDLIYFNTELIGERWGGPAKFQSKVLSQIQHLKHSKALKIVHPQDEWIYTDLLNDFINDFHIDHVFSVAPPSEWPIIYSRVDRTKVKFQLALTGYLDNNSISKLLAWNDSVKVKDIDIGYRATKAAEWYGSHGFLKTQIGELFKKEAPKAGFKVDISNEEKDRILGDGWYHFLARCKYVIGVEGGSTVHDPKGEIYFKGKAYKEAHPNATFAEVEQNCFPGQDGNLQLIAISPRHIECCAIKTCQVLVEGYYNGILEANKHYIPLKKDFSNLQEVFAKMKDEKLRQTIIEQAYTDIVSSGKYTYSNYVQQVIDQVDLSNVKSKGIKDWFYLKINQYYDHMFWKNQDKKSFLRTLNKLMINIYIFTGLRAFKKMVTA